MDVPAEWRGFSLPEFSATASVKKMTALILSLMETPQLKVTGIHLIAAFIRRRIHPMQARAHPMWAYQGVRDPTRISIVEFRSTEVWRRVWWLTDLGELEPCEIDPPGPDNETSNVSPPAKKRGREDDNPPVQTRPIGSRDPNVEPSVSVPAFKRTKSDRPVVACRFGHLARFDRANHTGGSVEGKKAPETRSTGQDSKGSDQPTKEKASHAEGASAANPSETSRRSRPNESTTPQATTPAPSQHPIISSMTTLIEEFEETKAERERLRAELDQCRQELKEAAIKKSRLQQRIDSCISAEKEREKIWIERLESATRSVVGVLDASAEVQFNEKSQSFKAIENVKVINAEAKGKLWQLAEVSLRQPHRSIEEINLASSGGPEVGDLSLDIFDSLSPL
ncbi:hypothetical protein BRADI_5g06069v3 [Brachypodium distachyon]|uniref:Uncharacterized protein n=1 Tax=Brachypodium distachyon TaxID=15368 RepID=A0A0Q3GMW5_BRADI|nr:hypothetical protein BRADI_5g06069v3 [Brachypodium distachyon]